MTRATSRVRQAWILQQVKEGMWSWVLEAAEGEHTCAVVVIAPAAAPALSQLSLLPGSKGPKGMCVSSADS